MTGKIPFENYDEYPVLVDGGELVFFFNSGLFIDHIPKSLPHMHAHFHHEIFTVLRGEMRILTEVGTVSISAGETVLIPANLSHKSDYSDDILRVSMAFVEPECVASESGLYKKLSEITGGGIVRYSSPHIAQSVERLIDYLHGDFKFRESLVSACLSELAALLCQSGEGGEDGARRSSDSRNYRKYIISGRLDRAFASSSYPIVPPSLEELSKSLHLSVKQTERTVRSMYGRSFGEQVIYLKMKKAAELLLRTDMTVNKISSAVGYSSTRSFFSAFKKAFDLTPMEYRRMHSDSSEEA